MKKIMFTFIVLFLLISTSKALTKFSLADKVPNMHIESIKGDNVHNGIPFVIRSEDKIIYCLNPFEKINTINEYFEYNYNDPIFDLTNEQLNKINLIAYYGYNYINHSDLKWYGITQFLIWKTLNIDDIYFTDVKDGNKVNMYDEEINELEALVKEHLTLPNLNNINYELPVNSGYRLYDNNKVISNYEIKSSELDAYIKDNYIHVSTKEVGDYEITLIRKSPIDNNFILYNLDGSQSLISPGKVEDMEIKFNIKVTSGSITINKIDSESNESKYATLQGAEYGIYNNGNRLIGKIKTNEKGIAFIDNLIWDQSYYVKELVPSYGYKLDENVYEVTLTKKQKNIVVNSYENIIKGNLIINKYYGEDNNYLKEDGATFEIYNDTDELIGTYETKNGTINESLKFGEYYAIQTKGISGYEFIDKFNISIKEEKEYIFDLYNKKETLIVDVPNTKVNNYNKYISFIFILIGLLLILKTKKKTIH